MGLTYNTLVVSDLHLGEDLSPSATEANRIHIEVVERQLVAFLRYYARRREDGRPWRLIVNGDFVDFLAVCIFPDHPDFESESHPLHHREFGLPRTPRVAVAKLELVVERHLETFRALARFLSRGNRVEIVSGNHDTEFHWPLVQEAFRSAVARAWRGMPESNRPGAVTATDVTAQIGFHPWFFYEEGVLWVEHGHQYDECCSFDHQLHPRSPDGDEIITNVDSAGTRFITNRVREADPHNQETWSFIGYLRFGISLGLVGSLHLTRAYFIFSLTLLKVWRTLSRRRAGYEQVRRGHRERLEALASAWKLDIATLDRLDDLHRRPVVSRLRKVASVAMIDKVLAYSVGIVAAVAAFVLFDGLLAFAGAAAALGAARIGTWWSGRGRVVDAGATLMIMPDRIRRHIDARVVTFGHTHEPVAQPLADGGWYYNTGSWVPTGKPGLLRSFTHVIVRHRDDGGVDSLLCQWRDGASRAFTPGWQPTAHTVNDMTPVPSSAAANRRQRTDSSAGGKTDGAEPAQAA